MANTKLTQEQKQDLKFFRKNYNAFVANNGEDVTVAYRRPFPNSHMVEFALSTKAPTEKKFRPKVGEYFARSNLESGYFVAASINAFESMMDALAIYDHPL